MDENGHGHVGNDIEKGARKTAQAAKTAVQAGKAIAKAAAGDYVGAAKDALKSEGLRKFIIILVCLSLLMTILIFFAAPMAIYEGIKAYTDTIRERWLEAYYESNSNRLFAAIKATLSGAWDIISDFWDLATSGVTQNSSTSTDTDQMTSDDITVLGPQTSLIAVYTKKIDAVINKMTARSDMIQASINASANGSLYDTNTINGWIYNYLYCNRDYGKYAYLSDTRNVYYSGVSVTTAAQKMTKREAVKIIALYSAMYNQDMDLIKPYSLMKWLGYYSATSATPVSFLVGDAVYCGVTGWQGEFMPMYLMEEALVNEAGDYSRYMAPAADVLLVVASDPLASLSPLVQQVEDTKLVPYTAYGYKYTWRLMDDATYASYYPGKYTNAKAYLTYIPSWTMYPEEFYRGDLTYTSNIRSAYNNGQLKWHYVKDYCYYTDYYTETVYDYYISYSFNASISVRSSDTIAKLAGFYEKVKTP